MQVVETAWRNRSVRSLFERHEDADQLRTINTHQRIYPKNQPLPGTHAILEFSGRVSDTIEFSDVFLSTLDDDGC